MGLPPFSSEWVRQTISQFAASGNHLLIFGAKLTKSPARPYNWRERLHLT
jgi:hypothetical protein